MIELYRSNRFATLERGSTSFQHATLKALDIELDQVKRIDCEVRCNVIESPYLNFFGQVTCTGNSLVGNEAPRTIRWCKSQSRSGSLRSQREVAHIYVS